MPIIKCPECGQDTSSMALTCPHCSTKIRGHVRQCPTCTSWISTEVVTCPNCDNTLQAGENTIQEEAQPIEATITTPHEPKQASEIPKIIAPTKKTGKKRGWGCLQIFLFVLPIAICLTAISYGAYQYHIQQQAQLDSLRQELAKRISEDQKMNNLKLYQAQQDSILWQHTLKTKTIEATHKYVIAYPEGIFIDEAYMLLEELQRRHVTPVEQQHIKGIIENSLAAIREQYIKNQNHKIQDIQYLLPDSLPISKKYITRDSIIYIVHSNAKKITILTGKTELDTTNIYLQMTLDKHKNIVESNLTSSANQNNISKQ